MLDVVMSFVGASIELFWFIGWRFFVLYAVYTLKGEKGLGHVLTWVCLWAAIYGKDLTFNVDSIAMLMNVMVGACVLTMIGISGMLWGIVLFWVGFSAERKGGFINNIFNNKDR